MTDSMLGAAAIALATAPAHRIRDVLEASLRGLSEHAAVTLYLADYRMRELMPAPASDAAIAMIEGSAAGRAFTSQTTVVENTPHDRRIFVPVTARGDRLGVLCVGIEGAPPREHDAIEAHVTEAAQHLALLCGPALLAADRVTDAYRVARRGKSLTLGAEIQWDLLPGRALDTAHARVAAMLEPAYSVVGDAFDWVSDAGGLSTLLVDGAGHGMRATANVAFAVSAVRNARREGADLTGVARMADQALHARPGGESFASCVLVDLAPDGSRVDLLLAGAATVWVGTRGSLAPCDLPRHPPLGVEEDYPYRPTTLAVEPGTRLLVASDGLTDAQVANRRFAEGFEQMAGAQRMLDPSETVRALIRELRTFHAGEPQSDDAVVMCIDIT